MAKRQVCPIVLLWPLVVLVAGCGHGSSSDPAASAAATPTVQVATVRRGSLQQILPGTGTLGAPPDREATLIPQVSGTLSGLFVHYGEIVRQGQIVAQISSLPVQGQIEQAQATLGQNRVQVDQAVANALEQKEQTRVAILQAQASVRNAEAALAGAQATLTGALDSLATAQQSLTREQSLFTEGLVAQKDVDAARLAVQTAQAQADAQRQAVEGQRQTVAGQVQALAAAQAGRIQDLVKLKDVDVARQQVTNAQGALETARAQLGLYTIRAPLTGTVTAVGAAEGTPVDTSSKLATISDLRTLRLTIDVPSGNASQVHPGQKILFTLDSIPRHTFSAIVQLVSPQIDPASGTVAVMATISNPNGAFRDDVTVSAQIVTARRDGVLIVPAASILTDPDTGKKSVGVLGRDSLLHIAPVRVGLTADGKAEIVSGLSDGQTIAVSGQYALADGTKVAVQPAGGSGSDGS
jgi:HlyD family secretion protein